VRRGHIIAAASLPTAAGSSQAAATPHVQAICRLSAVMSKEQFHAPQYVQALGVEDQEQQQHYLPVMSKAQAFAGIVAYTFRQEQSFIEYINNTN